MESVVVKLQTDYGFRITSDAEKLVSALSLVPFKDEEDIGKNSNDSLSLFKESRSRLLKGDTKVVDVGDSLMRERIFRLIDECCKSHLKRIADDVPMKAIESLEFYLRRASVELTEMKKEIAIRPDIWIGNLTREREHFNSYCGMLREALNKALFEDKVTLLENVKKLLHSCGHPDSNIFSAIQAALDGVNQIGSHPFFEHLMSVDTPYISKVGSTLTGIPAPWLSSSLMAPQLSSMVFEKKFSGQEHAVAALVNALKSTRDRDDRPLGIFLFHDPTSLYWEDFARYLSWVLYATGDLSLRLDLSADVDTLLVSANGKGKLCELLDDVTKKPFSVVMLENVDQAHDSVIDAVCGCLTGGCTLEGTSIDFSTTVFVMVSDNGSDPGFHPYCAAPSLLNHSHRRLKDLALDGSGTKGLCSCKLVLKKVKDNLSTKLWDLLDEVVLLESGAICNLKAYARSLLREIAARFCGGRLIIYPSETALAAAVYQADRVKGGIAVKRWLEENVVPTLKEMAERGDFDEKSIVFVDTYVGTNDLSYRVQKDGGYLADDITKNFSKFADDWRTIYGKGKLLEDNITILRKRLVELSAVINANINGIEFINAATVEEMMKIVDQAIEAANDINFLKDALGCSVEKEDALPSSSKKAEVTVESLRATFTSHSSRPEIIEVVKGAFLKMIDASEGTQRSPSSYLLLGLEDDGKRELLTELERSFMDSGIHLMKINLSDYSNEDSLSHVLTCSPGSSSYGCGWLQLVESVREHPYSILYFDQVERAHMSIFSLLISLLVHGVLVDGEGNMVDFGRTVIIIASDVGNKHVMARLVRRSLRKRKIAKDGGGQRDSNSPSPRQGEYRFRSELVNKVDEVIVFDPFAHEQLKYVARIPIASELPRKDSLRALRHDLSPLFAAGVDLSRENQFWPLAFLGLLKRVISEVTANGS